MPEQTAQFIENLVIGAGHTLSDEEKAALASKDISQLPDSLTKVIKEGYLTVQAATNHPKVRNQLFGKSHGNYDTSIWQFVRDELKVEPGDYYTAEFRGVKDDATGKPKESIYDRLPVVFNKIKELIESRAEARAGKDTTQLRAELEEELKGKYASQLTANTGTIEGLQTKLVNAHDEIAKLKATFESELENERIKQHLGQELGRYQLKKDFDEEVQAMIMANTKEKILSGFVIKKDAESGQYQPFQKSDPTARAMTADNKILTLEDLVKGELAKYIDPNPAAPPPNGGNGKVPPVKTPVGGGVNGNEKNPLPRFRSSYL